MDRNPYAPPNSPVADVAPGRPTEVDPKVRRACVLIWWSFAATMAVEAMTFFAQAPAGVGAAGSAVGLVTITVVGILMALWMTSKLRAGRNWMRLLYTILFAFGILSMILLPAYTQQTFALYASHPLLGVLSVVNWILNVYIVVLINSKSARDWFAAMKASAT
jgi:hypothetical protein